MASIVKKNFYRKEYLAIAFNVNKGNEVIHYYRYGYLLTLSWILVVVCLLLFIFTASYTQRYHAIGAIVPEKGIIKITPNVNGVIENIYIKEGEEVKAGQPLYLIKSDLSFTDNHTNMEGVINEISNQIKIIKEKKHYDNVLFEARKSDMEKQRKMISKSLDINKEIMFFTLKRQKMINDGYVRFEQLNKKGFLSEIDLIQKKQERFSFEIMTLNNREKINELERELSSFEQKLASLDEENILLQLQSNERIASLERDKKIYELKYKRLITSPRSGLAGYVKMEVGDIVNDNSVLMQVIPDIDNKVVKIFIPSRVMGIINDNQSVSIKVNSFPYEKYGVLSGIITNISKAAVEDYDSMSDLAFLSRKDSYYRLYAKIDEDANPNLVKKIKSGMRVSADIAVEEKKIYEWLFSPFFKMKSDIAHVVK
ncbi:HlyD family efflux transporter periplasmic adaptor subunit [Aeromonas encheleia]|uniref:HlyD family secretion protein n=1 Tax=Aeromonas encheleia TaxID=73010 RepID=UPI001F583C8E|nr:HlyD family efflux transporter periplasmic adaptor subunit [Aeromonas encheleia]UNP89296.1 HlyD family efflux transporter periplasmic adaptor subunit [Aeromonas encheleia]